MAANIQRIVSLLPKRQYGPSKSSIPKTICGNCLRSFTTSSTSLAGHNKWSKTKHIKAVTDKKKMSERTAFTKLIALYSKLYGDNIAFNPQLANAISAATKASIPKNLIEAAVARGQGRSTTGAQLEAITFEALMPPSIAIIADVETDNKTRTMHDLKYVVKKAGGISSSSAFYFARRGRSVFKAKDNGPALSDMLDEAIEHDGVEDVEDSPDGGFVMWTEPSVLMAVTEAFSKKFELEIAEADIVWAPNEDTKVGLDSDESAEALDTLLGGLKEYPEVKGLYINTHRGSLSQETWDKVERHIDA